MKLTMRRLISADVLGPSADILHRGATLKDLIHATPPNSYRRGVARVEFRNLSKNNGLWHITYRVYGSEDYSDPRGHDVKFRFLPDPDALEAGDLEVEVSCPCYAFVYWGAQYNVKQRNALEREIKGRDGLINTGPPDPTYKPPRNYVICKHIKAASERCVALLSKHLKKLSEESKPQEP